MVDLINNWTDPFPGHAQLFSISTGAVATTDIADDLANAYKVGEAAYKNFKKSRLESQPPTVKFHDTLKKQNLKTFSALSKTKKVAKNKNIETVLRANRNLFARMIIIAESHSLQMRNVLKHPLGPFLFPWPAALVFPAKQIKDSLERN